MAYHGEDDTYSFDCCRFRNKWDASDDIHGELRGCEKYGNEEYMRMMQDSNEIYCPDCWANKRREDD